MTKEQYAKMLREICEIHKAGGDTRACIAKYTERYKYVYIYNDDIFKVLLGNPANEAVTVDFLNAVLKLDGADCIDHVTFANPVSPEAFAKTSTSDIVADDQHKDRIVLEVQHVNGKSYADRLVLYAAKHVVAGRVKGEDYCLRNLNLISLQMFNGFPRSGNYRHSIRLKNQENEVFYEKQTITLVEIPKFLKGNFTKDNSRLALWLRFFESLNDETVGNAVIDPMFRLLQERAKLSTFTNEFLVSEAMKMGDHNYELYVEKARAREEGLSEGRAEGRAEGRVEGRAEARREMAKGLRDAGVSISLISKQSGLSENEILAL